MQTRFQGLEEGLASSKVELVDLTTPEPTHNDCLSNVSTPPIIDLVTPKPVQVIDLRTPEPGQLVVSVVNLSTPELEQLVLALSLLARALEMAQCRPPGL
jgi:hypothetical protein